MIIQSTKVWVANNFRPLQLEVMDDKIVDVLAYGTKPVDRDYGDDRILPGFIDVHTHGAYGFDTNDGTPEGLRTWAKRLPVDEGTTSFLPTTITQSHEVLCNANANVAKVMEEGYEGANILGIHMEGPFIDMAKKGAQPPEYVRDADVEEFKQFQQAANGKVRYMTMAPEHDKDHALIKYCHSTGVRITMGHTSATYQQAVLGIAAGATSMTHVYNGMSGYGHRELGMVGTAFRVRDVFGEIICDGYHSTPDALNNYFITKGADYGIMISDSLRCKGLPEGDYTSGGAAITLTKEGTAYLTGTNTLAGSTLRMNKGLQVLIEKALIPVDTAINASALNPARMLGIDDHKGKLIAGYDADIVVLDCNYDVVQCYVMGKEQK